MTAPDPKDDKRPTPLIVKDVPALRAYREKLRAGQKTLALVPTMGALHDGHLSLVKAALKKADHVMVSIFVNPTQFAPHEDLAAYPRTWESDCEKLTMAGAHAIYHPSIDTMYPPDFAATIHIEHITAPLEGVCRPGHFDGVATVVAKLFMQAQSDCAFFGEKDYQQLQMIRKMVVDLDMAVTIYGLPTLRDDHGLALSSRNAYLSDAERTIARQLNKILHEIAHKIKHGTAPRDAEQWGHDEALRCGFDAVDYIAAAHAETLAPLHDPAHEPGRILAAVRLGKARLIDNIALS